MTRQAGHVREEVSPDIEAELAQLAKRRGVTIEALLDEVRRWLNDHPGSDREFFERAIGELEVRRRQLRDEMNRLTRMHSALTGRRSVLRFNCGEQIRSCETLSMALIGLRAQNRRLCSMLSRAPSIVENDEVITERYVSFARKS